MKITLEWISNFVDISCFSIDEIVRVLTMSGLEVEYKHAIEKVKNVVVCKILSVDKHPYSDHLNVCKVYDGSDTYNVVCGANNIYENMNVPYARVGSTIANNVKIEKTVIRDIESWGMICSAADLGLESKSEGILPLTETALEGSDVNNILGLPDYVLDLSVTPNRGDCLSIRGVARELSAVFNRTFQDISFTLDEDVQNIADFIDLEVENEADCSCYIGRLIKDVQVGQSPLWLQLRLMKLGLKPINNVVDTSNYVLLECGQPLHTFDYNKINKNIIVRRAKMGEEIILLDSSKVNLQENFLVIADSSGPIAIAGIMGSSHSSIDTKSRNVFLECACFDPYLIRKTAKAINIQTDASFRFERGIDAGDMDRLGDYAAYLLQRLANGKVLNGKVLRRSNVFRQKKVIFSPDRINILLGTNIKEIEQINILKRLNIDVSHESEHFSAKIPSYRNDLYRDVDLAEEVARVVGLENIPLERSKNYANSQYISEDFNFIRSLKNRLSILGFNEVINYSFIDSSFLSNFDDITKCVFIKNPISEELNALRTLIFPSLIKNAILNQSHGIKEVRLFEVSKVFSNHQKNSYSRPDLLSQGCTTGIITDPSTENQKSLPIEKTSIGILIASDFWPLNWVYKGDIDSFFYLKGVVENLFKSLKINVKFKNIDYKFLHPGKSCNLIIDNNLIGFMGQLHPKIVEKLDLFKPLYVAELSLDLIYNMHNKTSIKYIKYSIYPYVYKDISLIVDDNFNADNLKDFIYKTSELIVNVDLFDVFRDVKLGLNKKSLAFRITFNDFSKTLTDEKTNKILNEIIERAKIIYNAVLRV